MWCVVLYWWYDTHEWSIAIQKITGNLDPLPFPQNRTSSRQSDYFKWFVFHDFTVFRTRQRVKVSSDDSISYQWVTLEEYVSLLCSVCKQYTEGVSTECSTYLLIIYDIGKQTYMHTWAYTYTQTQMHAWNLHDRSCAYLAQDRRSVCF